MIDVEPAIPEMATREQWLAKRLALLQHEKELTRQRDRVNAERRRLPMVRVEKEYTFRGPAGSLTFIDLFEGQKQLVVYHFMFDPSWEKGCGGCTAFADALGNLAPLKDRNTAFCMVSRAPLPKLEAYKASHAWAMPWYSSFGSDFNYAFLDLTPYGRQEDFEDSPPGWPQRPTYG